MRILLIDPPFKRFTNLVNYYFPLGLAYLAAVLKKNDYEVKIYEVDGAKRGGDINFSEEYRRLELYVQGLQSDEHPVWQEIKDELLFYKPDVVGISSMTTKFGSVLRVARVCKEVIPDCRVVLGGPHPTILPEQCLKVKDVDFVIRGEGERSFLELLGVISSDGELSKVEGLSYKDGKKVVHNEDRELIADLGEIPLPARDLLMNLKNYTSEDMGMIISSRGCPFNCTYCFHSF
ncbi:MAG: hypothetical protein COS84_05885, partial [Armatimonadetes bacterium CG07_land_8_20_14_0_80_40_9]